MECRYEKFYTNIKENKHSINEARKKSKALRVPDKKIAEIKWLFQ